MALEVDLKILFNIKQKKNHYSKNVMLKVATKNLFLKTLNIFKKTGGSGASPKPSSS